MALANAKRSDAIAHPFFMFVEAKSKCSGTALEPLCVTATAELNRSARISGQHVLSYTVAVRMRASLEN